MIERFVDTSGWAELADRTLLFHDSAVAAFDEVWNQGGRLITTNWVIVELTALLTSPLRMPKSQQLQLVGDLRADPSVDVVFVDPTLEYSGLEPLAITPRQGYGRLGGLQLA